jgi:glycosyltransferase involved in cell wall biosynthesis
MAVGQQMRRILVQYFSNESVRGGAEEHILTLLRGLDRTLFRLQLVCPPELTERMGSDVPEDVEVVRVSLRKPSQVAAAARLASVIRASRVDILHAHLFHSSLFASPIAKLCGVPLVVETPHVREQWRRGWKSHYLVDRLAGRCVDYFIAVSEANARYLVTEKGLPERKVVVIHNGSDLTRFRPDHPRPQALRETLGFAADDMLVVVLGRLEPQKGHRVLLDALPAVQREFPRVRLICVGEGSLRGELESRARAVNLDASVRFVGYQANVPDWLALADLTVLPSFYEGLPLAAIESLAAGRPVVATAVDGTPEVVVDGRTGLTVPAGNPDRLAHAICRLLRDPDLRERLGRAGRQWVQDEFSQKRQIHKTQQFYLHALTGRGRVYGSTTSGQPGVTARQEDAPVTERVT